MDEVSKTGTILAGRIFAPFDSLSGHQLPLLLPPCPTSAASIVAAVQVPVVQDHLFGATRTSNRKQQNFECERLNDPPFVPRVQIYAAWGTLYRLDAAEQLEETLCMARHLSHRGVWHAPAHCMLSVKAMHTYMRHREQETLH